MQEYKDLKKKLDSVKQEIESLMQKTANRVLHFGKYKGKTIQYIITYNEQYFYWLLRETNMDIDPELFGYKMPTKGDILRLLDLKYSNGKFIKDIIHPGIYDNWNVGHYGCKEPTCIKEETVEHHEFSFDDILSNGREYIGELTKVYPYIKWTKEYLKSLFNENSRK